MEKIQASQSLIQSWIHIVFSTRERIPLSLSTTIQKIKASLSKWIKSLGDENNNLVNFNWQSGYGAFRVSYSNINAVKRYINCQEIHHEKLGFKEEFLELLNRHDVKYDEKYLWEN